MSYLTLKNLVLLLILFAVLSGCGKKDSSPNNIRSQTLQNIQKQQADLNIKLNQLVSEIKNLKTSFTVYEADTAEIKELLENIQQQRQNNLKAYNQFLAKINQSSETLKQQSADYENFIEDLERRIQEYETEHRNNIERYQAISYKSTKPRPLNKKMFGGSAENMLQEQDSSSGKAVTDGAIQGTIRKGKISGLKSGYKTY